MYVYIYIYIYTYSISLRSTNRDAHSLAPRRGLPPARARARWSWRRETDVYTYNLHLRLINYPPPPKARVPLKSELENHLSLCVHYQRAQLAANFGAFFVNAASATGDTQLGDLGGSS